MSIYENIGKIFKSNLLKGDLILFLPTFFIYLVYIYVGFQNEAMNDDEIRYLKYAKNILNGFYSESGGEANLMNGPGYPMIIAFFMLFKSSNTIICMGNALFFYLANVFFYKSLSFYLSKKKSILGALIFIVVMFNYNREPLIRIFTEPFTIFLITLLMYFFLSYIHKRKWNHLLFFSISLTFLSLTKVIFGYVVVTAIIIIGIWQLLKPSMKKSYLLIGFSLSLLFAAPYLIYTYNLTGKIFNWGGPNDTLYWMTTPYDNEYGDWINIITDEEKIKENHADLIEINQNSTNLEVEDYYLEKAIENISQHPYKFIKNWFSNIERMLFGFPYSYKMQKPLFFSGLIPGMLFLFFLIYTITISRKIYNKVPQEVYLFIVIAVIYLGGTSLASAIVRYFQIVVPIFLFWFMVVLFKIKLQVNLDQDISIF